MQITDMLNTICDAEMQILTGTAVQHYGQ